MSRQSNRAGSAALAFVADALVIVAALCLMLMIVITVADVVLGAVAGTRIFGAYEMVGLLMAPVGFLPMAKTLLKDRHLTVELIDHVVSDRGLMIFQLVGVACVFVFAAVLAVFVYDPMMNAISYGEVTPDREIPLIYKIAPIYVGLVAAALCAGFLVFSKLSAFIRQKGS